MSLAIEAFESSSGTTRESGTRVLDSFASRGARGFPPSFPPRIPDSRTAVPAPRVCAHVTSTSDRSRGVIGSKSQGPPHARSVHGQRSKVSRVEIRDANRNGVSVQSAPRVVVRQSFVDRLEARRRLPLPLLSFMQHAHPRRVPYTTSVPRTHHTREWKRGAEARGAENSRRIRAADRTGAHTLHAHARTRDTHTVLINQHPLARSDNFLSRDRARWEKQTAATTGWKRSRLEAGRPEEEEPTVVANS